MILHLGISFLSEPFVPLAGGCRRPWTAGFSSVRPARLFIHMCRVGRCATVCVTPLECVLFDSSVPSFVHTCMGSRLGEGGKLSICLRSTRRDAPLICPAAFFILTYIFVFPVSYRPLIAFSSVGAHNLLAPRVPHRHDPLTYMCGTAIIQASSHFVTPQYLRSSDEPPRRGGTISCWH